MEEAPGAQNPKQSIVQDIIDVGTKAFDPANDEASRDATHERYNELVNKYVSACETN